MIRIDNIKPTAGQVVLKMAGQLTWETAVVPEVEARRWLQHRERPVLELDDVDFIDTTGINLLKGLIQQGVSLRGGSPFIALLLARHGIL